MNLSVLGFSGLVEVPNWHPMFTHYPLALFPAALLFILAAWAFKRESLWEAGKFCIYLATALVIPTVITGWRAMNSIPHDETLHQLMTVHRTIGIVICALSLVLSLWSLARPTNTPRSRWAFIAVLGLLNMAILQNGDLGSRMVYVHGAGVNSATKEMGGGESMQDHSGMQKDGKDYGAIMDMGPRPPSAKEVISGESGSMESAETADGRGKGAGHKH